MRQWALVLCVAGLSTAFLLAPLPSAGRVGDALQDLAHLPLGAVLGLAVERAIRRRPRPELVPSIVALGIASAILGLLEIVQRFAGRSSSWADWLAGSGGAASALALEASRGLGSARSRWALRALAIAAFLVPTLGPGGILLDARRQAVEMPRLASFEHALELGRWAFGSSTARRSAAHATHGAASLEVRLVPGRYPRATLAHPPPDWRGHEALAMDVFLDEGGPLSVVVEVTDEPHDGSYSDGFHRRVHLAPGANRVRIPLDEIARGPRSRRLDLRRISAVMLLADRLERPRTLFLDDVRLERAAAISSGASAPTAR